MHYSAVNGNLDYQEDGRGSVSRVTFDYVPSGQAVNQLLDINYPIDQQGVAGREYFWYDSLGNVDSTHTPAGIVSRFRKDNLGRVTSTRTLATAIAEAIDSTVYDVMDRDSVSQTIGPKMALTGDQLSTVLRAFDEEGNLTSLTRYSTPDSADIGSVTTTWAYDDNNRQMEETAPDGRAQTLTLDPAGNVTSMLTRRNLSLSMTYDALNRLTQRILPQVLIPEETFDNAGFPRYTNGLRIAGDTETFSYDSLGNITRANNRDAKVARQYTSAGLLIRDSLFVRAYDSTSTTYSHAYAVSYAYDRNRRRSTFTDPEGFVTTYGYSPKFGALTDLAVQLFSSSSYYHFAWSYDSLGRVTQYGLPPSFTTSNVLDLDGRLLQRILTSTAYQSPVLGQGNKVYSDTMQYDTRGLLAHAGALADQTDLQYSGLGHTDERITLPRLAQAAVEERFRNDALGTLLWSSQFNGTWPRRIYAFERGTGRQRTSTHETGDISDSTFYDSTGNVKRVRTLQDVRTGVSISVLTDSRFYYDAAERLRVVDKRTGPGSDTLASYGVPQRLLDAYEEYRYDALGRRILKRTRREFCEAWCVSAIERYMWDGDNLVRESRYPGREGISMDSLEADTGFVVMQKIPHGPPNPPPTDSTYVYSPHYGVVTYLHGPGLDQPLGVIRWRYARDSTRKMDWATFFPHYDWHGTPSGSMNNTDLFAIDREIQWPGGSVSLYGSWPSTGPMPPWFGSLIWQQQDASGLQYKRNRYYDAVKGRFTQEDPIGLAGGLNLYGFASGDPVNFSDPFGLQSCVLGLPCPVVVGGAAVLGGPLSLFGAAVAGVVTLDATFGSQGGYAGIGAAAAADATSFQYRPGGRFSPKSKRKIDQDATDATGAPGVCEYCGVVTVPDPGSGTSVEGDHLVPRSKGGSNDPANGRRSCRDCNRRFGDKDKPDPRQPRPQ